ncbi:MAG: TetR/AcrR family transcriptional regulator [Alphaproteobacteria bacterium]
MIRARPYDRDTALNAAMTLFWAKGYHATSLKDLEAALKMKPGSIYAAFNSKEDLYRATLERYFQTLQNQFQSLLETENSPLNVLTHNLREVGRPLKTGEPCHACMLIKTILGEMTLDTAIAEDARRYLAQLNSVFVDLFDKAKAMGEIPQDTDCRRLALRYQSSLSALKIEHQRGTDARDIENLAEDMAHDFERLRR